MKFIWIILFASILAASCRSTRNINTAIAKKDTIASADTVIHHEHEDSMAYIAQLYNQVTSHHIDYTTFSGKVEVDYTDADGKKYNVNAHVRMYKDSVIWLTITGLLGIEGLRAYITKDSVKLLDKQNKVYTARSVSYLQDVTALPLDLHTLQELIIGNSVYFDPNIISYSRTDNSISLQGLNRFFKSLVTIGIDDKLVQSIKLDDIDPAKNRTCLLTYGDYENKKSVNFPTERKIHVAEKKNLDIKLDFKQYEFNETLSFPFTVPKNYELN